MLNKTKLKELYELTIKISELEPWEWLYDIDLFAIQPNGYLEPFFISIMGHQGNCYGISCYYGGDGFADFDALSQEVSNLTVSYLMSDISCLTCYFDVEENIDDETIWEFEDFDLHPQEDKYFYFLSFEPRYYPGEINDEELNKLVEVYKGLYYALDEWINQHSFDLEWEKNEIVFAYQKEEDWNIKIVKRPNIQREYPDFVLDDEYLDVLKKCPRQNISISLELMYLNEPTMDEKQKTEKPFNPLLFLFLNNDTNEFLETEFIGLDQDETDFVLDHVTNYMEQNGIPDEIHYHNPYIESAVKDLCKKLDIDMVYDDLEDLQDFIEQVMQEPI